MKKKLDKNDIGIYRGPSEYQYLNYNDRPEGTVIDTIVIHYTAGEFKASYLTLTAPRGVSAHYLIDRDGRIDNLVSEEKRAWHAGVSHWHKDNVNDFSIGIELVNSGSGQSVDSNGKITWEQIDPFPQAQMVSLVALIDYIKENNPIKDYNIVGHSDIALGRKLDPGIAFDWKYLSDNGHGLYPKCNEDTATTALYKFGDSGNGVKAIQEKLTKYGYNVPVTGQFDKSTENAVRAFNMHFHNDIASDYEAWDNLSEMTLDSLLTQI